MKRAHGWVPGAEELACDKVVGREDGVEDEVEDGELRVIRWEIIVFSGTYYRLCLLIIVFLTLGY